MTRTERLELIKEIETERNSRVLVYVTGDRQGLQTKIGVDTFPFIAKHINQFGQAENIDLFLYSTGGITMAGYSLVNLIREHCKHFGVLIPFKALSCATLVALGADDIVMSKMGQLSPIDPSVGHPLGPSIPAGPSGARQILPISVEDLFNYLDFIRDELKIKDVDSLERVVENLAGSLHPLVLGHAYRLREQIEFLADNLLSYHMVSAQKRKDIIKKFTRGRFSHNYIFSRREAKDRLELPITDSEKTESLIVSLFEKYQQMLELPDPHSPELAIGENDESRVSFDRAIIESIDLSHVFRSERIFRRVNIPIPNTQIVTPQVIEGNIHEGWIEDNTI